MMVDLDIPISTQPTTFLHWLQTDLKASTTPETIMTSSGNLQGFGVNLANNTAAIINYTQPNPPAQNPLSHRYTQLLIDTSAITPAGLTALQTAAQSRVNFNINTTLQAAGLSQNVISWNFFNVTNPGPAAAANVATGGQSAKANADAATTANSTDTTGTGKKGAKAQKAKGGKGAAAAAATNSTATATGGKKNKGGVSAASAGNSTTAGTGKGGKKNKGAGANVTAQSNSTTADTGKKGGKKAKGAAGNSTTTDTGNGGKKNKGGKGDNTTSASTASPSSADSTGATTGVAAGAVTSSNSTAGTVTVSGSPEQRALHSVLLSLCLVGAAALGL